MIYKLAIIFYVCVGIITIGTVSFFMWYDRKVNIEPDGDRKRYGWTRGYWW